MQAPKCLVTLSVEEFERLKSKEREAPLSWTRNTEIQLVNAALVACDNTRVSFEKTTVYKETVKVLKKTHPEAFGALTASKVSTKLRELLTLDELCELRERLESEQKRSICPQEVISAYKELYPLRGMPGSVWLERRLSDQGNPKMRELRSKMLERDNLPRWQQRINMNFPKPEPLEHPLEPQEPPPKPSLDTSPLDAPASMLKTLLTWIW